MATSLGAAAAAAVPDSVLSGVEFGMGVFNCTASVLPAIVLKVIAVFGFPSDKEAGLQQLRLALQRGGIRAALSALFLLAMRVLLPSFHSGDLDATHVAEADAILGVMMDRFPNSALFLWMAGRLARLKGEVASATAYLDQCARTQSEWVQLSHLCAYEIGWCRVFAHDWRAVLGPFALLSRENEWSKAFYTYMTGVSLLQQGRVALAREAFQRVVRVSSRRFGGKLISAEQYAIRRAAEFLALTYVDRDAHVALCTGKGAGAGAVDTAEDKAADRQVDEEIATALALPTASPGAATAVDPTLGSSSVPAALGRARLPCRVPVGSVAHAAVLAYPVPFIGLEASYLFNGAAQMDTGALLSAVAQIDAVLLAVADGHAFDHVTGDLWTGEVDAHYAGTGGANLSIKPLLVRGGAWKDSSEALTASTAAAASSTPTTADAAASTSASTTQTLRERALAWQERAQELRRLLDRACGVTVTPAATSVPLAKMAHGPAPSGGAGTPGSDSTPTPKSGGGFFGRLFASGPSPADLGLDPITLPAACAPSQLLPIHTAATGALCRGAFCSVMGLVDEAVACLQWVIEKATASPGSGPLRRDLHLVSYAQYELGVIYSNGLKALNRGESSTTAQNQSRGHVESAGSTGRPSILHAHALAGLTAANMRASAKKHFAAAREIRDDFNWKVRLHLRAHLSVSELPVTGKQKTKTAAAAAAGPKSDVDEAALLRAAEGADDTGNYTDDDEDDEEEA
jgi:hypothetical protein